MPKGRKEIVASTKTFPQDEPLQEWTDAEELALTDHSLTENSLYTSTEEEKEAAEERAKQEAENRDRTLAPAADLPSPSREQLAQSVQQGEDTDADEATVMYSASQSSATAHSTPASTPSPPTAENPARSSASAVNTVSASSSPSLPEAFRERLRSLSKLPELFHLSNSSSSTTSSPPATPSALTPEYPRRSNTVSDPTVPPPASLRAVVQSHSATPVTATNGSRPAAAATSVPHDTRGGLRQSTALTVDDLAGPSSTQIPTANTAARNEPVDSEFAQFRSSIRESVGIGASVHGRSGAAANPVQAATESSSAFAATHASTPSALAVSSIPISGPTPARHDRPIAAAPSPAPPPFAIRQIEKLNLQLQANGFTPLRPSYAHDEQIEQLLFSLLGELERRGKAMNEMLTKTARESEERSRAEAARTREIEADMKRQKKFLEAAERRVSELNAALFAEQRRAAADEARHSEEIEQLRTRLAMKESECAELHKQLDVATARLIEQSRFTEKERDHDRQREREVERMREDVARLERELGVVRQRFEEAISENRTLKRELEQHPIAQQWVATQQRLEMLEKRMKEHSAKLPKQTRTAKASAGVQSTPEVAAKSTSTSSLPEPVQTPYRQLVQQACDELNITDPEELVTAIKKMCRAIAALPKMEKFIAEICRIVGSRPITPRIDPLSPGIVPERDVPVPGKRIAPDDVLPTLRLWLDDLGELQELQEFRAMVANELRKCRTMPNDPRLGAPIWSDTRKLAALLREVLSEAQRAATNDEREPANTEQERPDLAANKIVKHFQHLFNVKSVEGVLPVMNKMYLHLQEVANATKALRTILNLAPTAPLSVILEAVRGLVERTGKHEAWNEPQKDKERTPMQATKPQTPVASPILPNPAVRMPPTPYEQHLPSAVPERTPQPMQHQAEKDTEAASTSSVSTVYSTSESETEGEDQEVFDQFAKLVWITAELRRLLNVDSIDKLVDTCAKLKEQTSAK